MTDIVLKGGRLVLTAAFRYALGRRTCVVSWVVDVLVKNWGALDEGTRSAIKREIRDAIDRDGAGHPCDVAEWRRVLEMEP